MWNCQMTNGMIARELRERERDLKINKVNESERIVD